MNQFFTKCKHLGFLGILHQPAHPWSSILFDPKSYPSKKPIDAALSFYAKAGDVTA